MQFTAEYSTLPYSIPTMAVVPPKMPIERHDDDRSYHRLLAVDLIALIRPKSGWRILGSNESSGTVFVHIRTFLSSPPDANMPESIGFQDTLVTHCSFFDPFPCSLSLAISSRFSLCQMYILPSNAHQQQHAEIDGAFGLPLLPLKTKFSAAPPKQFRMMLPP